MAHKLQMYENLRDMLEREVGEIERKRELTKESLDNLFKLTAALKVADKCIEREKMEEMEKQGGGMSSESRMSRDRSGQQSYGYSYMNSGNNPVYGGGYMGNSNASYNMSGNMSNDMSGNYGNSNASNGMSGARRGRDGDGDGRYNESRESRESHDSFRYSQDRGRYSRNEGYSRDASRKKMVQKLETLMDDTMSENERQAIQDCITKIEK